MAGDMATLIPNLSERFLDVNNFNLNLICSAFNGDFICNHEMLTSELQWKYECFPSYELTKKQFSINIKGALTHGGVLWSY